MRPLSQHRHLAFPAPLRTFYVSSSCFTLSSDCPALSHLTPTVWPTLCSPAVYLGHAGSEWSQVQQLCTITNTLVNSNAGDRYFSRRSKQGKLDHRASSDSTASDILAESALYEAVNCWFLARHKHSLRMNHHHQTVLSSHSAITRHFHNPFYSAYDHITSSIGCCGRFRPCAGNRICAAVHAKFIGWVPVGSRHAW